MSHYDNCRPGYCAKCGAAPGNLRADGSCPFCSPRDEFNRPTVPCGLCGKPTAMTATKRCDGCWELERRIKRDPDLARRILEDL